MDRMNHRFWRITECTCRYYPFLRNMEEVKPYLFSCGNDNKVYQICG
ncbi:hypothetical protein BCE_A0087 (plasmid) [Bacillus cereus ATCC 10987]|uniref:Uncharacterized protein n=1 Tax=Bacillus cereus (strain ATCC 10987 / NRS 248) TaxID=222523 RepID=Q74P07_BACC1|nr:hypothetical protein BCE_A0087 [Bacillus cereus ATCC 10987]